MAEQRADLIPVTGSRGEMPAEVLEAIPVILGGVPAVRAFLAVGIEQLPVKSS